MNAVVERLVDIWKQDRLGAYPEVASRNDTISAHEALDALTATFSHSQIQHALEAFLFDVVEAYDTGRIPYKPSPTDGITVTSRANLCCALVCEIDTLVFSRHLMHEMIRAFPVLSWYQTIRRIIEKRVTKVDVLYALVDGLRSNRSGQVFSAAVGLGFYQGHAGHDGATPQSIDHAITRIRVRLDELLRKQSLHPLLTHALSAGMHNLEKWR